MRLVAGESGDALSSFSTMTNRPRATARITIDRTMTTGLMGSAGMTGTECLRVDACRFYSERLWPVVDLVTERSLWAASARDRSEAASVSAATACRRRRRTRGIHDVSSVAAGRWQTSPSRSKTFSRGLMRRVTRHDGGADPLAPIRGHAIGWTQIHAKTQVAE